jgi:hypothetical protein
MLPGATRGPIVGRVRGCETQFSHMFHVIQLLKGRTDRGELNGPGRTKCPRPAGPPSNPSARLWKHEHCALKNIAGCTPGHQRWLFRHVFLGWHPLLVPSHSAHSHEVAPFPEHWPDKRALQASCQHQTHPAAHSPCKRASKCRDVTPLQCSVAAARGWLLQEGGCCKRVAAARGRRA